VAQHQAQHISIAFLERACERMVAMRRGLPFVSATYLSFARRLPHNTKILLEFLLADCTWLVNLIAKDQDRGL
jgi:hypothetical protein